jgi:hypothetical protein
MLTSATKRYFLPFYEGANMDSEVEAAAVFVIAEVERAKGSGFLGRQPQERIEFLAEIGYPLWVYPKNNQVFFFDGLGKSNPTASYLEMPSTKAFMEAFEANSRPRENYETFLVDHANYFQQGIEEKRVTFEGLIVDSQFRQEFVVYRKEATDVLRVNLGLLLPSLEEATISAKLAELEKQQAAIEEDAQRLQECARLVRKTTGQYITEIDYESIASAEETGAKIKAQEQVVNPQIAQLNKDYNRRIKTAEESYNSEIESFQKLKTRTLQLIKRNQEETKEYSREAKVHAAKGHKVYEKRWREKIRRAQKELNGLKKELKNTDNSIKKVTDQKKQAVSQLIQELNREVKLARQSLLDLEAKRELKTRFFKEEKQKLLAQEKPVVESINKAIRLHEEGGTHFAAISMRDTSFKEPTLFYVPFYVTIYEVGGVTRYRIVTPSKINNLDFSSKFRSALGISKGKDLLAPRFRAIAALVDSIEVYVKENSVFEGQLWELGQRFNLLRNSDFQEKAKRGLVYLHQAGWFSRREQEEISRRLVD